MRRSKSAVCVPFFFVLTVVVAGALGCVAGSDPLPPEVTAEVDESIGTDPVRDNPAAVLPAYGAGISKPFVWPVSGTADEDWVAGGFTPRWKSSEGRYDFHPALDILPRITVNGVDQPMSQDAIRASPPAIRAVAAGVVEKVETLSSGKMIRIKHYINTSTYPPSSSSSNVYYTDYLHMFDYCKTTTAGCSSGDVRAVGEPVAQGEIIGHMGSADISDPSSFWHVHLEVRGHYYQFYAMNPLRYLPHSDNNGYQPEIKLAPDLPAGCQAAFDPEDPKLWVTYRSDHQEIDVNEVVVTITDLATGTTETRRVNYERRVGIAWFQDLLSDNYIKTTSSGSYEPGIAVAAEYDPDALPYGVTPIYDNCNPGATPRNVLHSTNETLSMELQFEGFTGAPSIRVDARVCDIFGACEEAAPVYWPALP